MLKSLVLAYLICFIMKPFNIISYLRSLYDALLTYSKKQKCSARQQDIVKAQYQATPSAAGQDQNAEWNNTHCC